jgi:hypothetical protein
VECPRAAAAGQNPIRRIGFDQTSRDLQVLRRYIMRNILLETGYQRAMLEIELEWVRAVLDEQGTVDPQGAGSGSVSSRNSPSQRPKERSKV